jgi:hypothetical protein
MGEICASGSVGGEGGNVLAYPALQPTGHIRKLDLDRHARRGEHDAGETACTCGSESPMNDMVA